VDVLSRQTDAPEVRDRSLRRMRAAAWVAGIGAAGLTAGLSVVAAHAFKGHDGHAQAASAVTRAKTAGRHLSVPPPQQVPSIDGSNAPLQPPSSPPSAASQQSSPPAASSGGS
jgi:hypothetical protein